MSISILRGATVVVNETCSGLDNLLIKMVIKLYSNAKLYCDTPYMYWDVESISNASIYLLRNTIKMKNIDIVDKAALFFCVCSSQKIILNSLKLENQGKIYFNKPSSIIADKVQLNNCENRCSLGNMSVKELDLHTSTCIFDFLKVEKLRIRFAVSYVEPDLTCLSGIEIDSIAEVMYYNDHTPLFSLSNYIESQDPLAIISAPNLPSEMIFQIVDEPNHFNGLQTEDGTIKYFRNSTIQGLIIINEPFDAVPSICLYENRRDICPAGVIAYNENNVEWEEVIKSNITKNIFIYLTGTITPTLTLPYTKANFHIQTVNELRNRASIELNLTNTKTSLYLDNINVAFLGDSISLGYLSISNNTNFTRRTTIDSIILTTPYQRIIDSIVLKNVKNLKLDMRCFDVISLSFSDKFLSVGVPSGATLTLGNSGVMKVIVSISSGSELHLSCFGVPGSPVSVVADGANSGVSVVVDESFNEFPVAALEIASIGRIDVELYSSVIPIVFYEVGLCSIIYRVALPEVRFCKQPFLSRAVFKGINMSSDLILSLATLYGDGSSYRLAFKREHFDSTFSLRISSLTAVNCRLRLESVSLCDRISLNQSVLELSDVDVPMAEVSISDTFYDGEPRIIVLPGQRSAAAPRSVLYAAPSGAKTALPVVRFVGQPEALWRYVVYVPGMDVVARGNTLFAVQREDANASIVDAPLFIGVVTAIITVALVGLIFVVTNCNRRGLKGIGLANSNLNSSLIE